MLARLIILVLLTSCASGFVVKVDSDESFSATKYKDFKIFKPDPFRIESDEEENPIRINRIAKALSSSLVQLGLDQNDQSPLKVSFSVKEKERYKQILCEKKRYQKKIMQNKGATGEPVGRPQDANTN